VGKLLGNIAKLVDKYSATAKNINDYNGITVFY